MAANKDEQNQSAAGPWKAQLPGTAAVRLEHVQVSLLAWVREISSHAFAAPLTAAEIGTVSINTPKSGFMRLLSEITEVHKTRVVLCLCYLRYHLPLGGRCAICVTCVTVISSDTDYLYHRLHVPTDYLCGKVTCGTRISTVKFNSHFSI